MKNILVVDNAKIGDLVCATPVFRAIKEQYPDANITLLGNPKTFGVLQNNPHLGELIEMPKTFAGALSLFQKLLKRNFDASVALVPGTLNYLLPFTLNIPIRSATVAPEYGLFYRALSFFTVNQKKRFLQNTLSIRHYLDLLNPLGIYNSNLKKEVFFSAGSMDKAKEFLRSRNILEETILVGYSISAGNKIKEWPLHKFVDVAKMIFEKYRYMPVVIGDRHDEPQVCEAIKLLKDQSIPAIAATHFPLEELPAFLSLLHYFVSVDTGTLYIANALGVPVVDIAGPCNIYDQMPIYEKCEVVYIPNLPGWPYSSVLRTATHLSKEEERSILEITPEMVMNAFSRLVNKYDQR